MTAAQGTTGDDAAAETARAKIAEAGQKMAGYRAAALRCLRAADEGNWNNDARSHLTGADRQMIKSRGGTGPSRAGLYGLIGTLQGAVQPHHCDLRKRRDPIKPRIQNHRSAQDDTCPRSEPTSGHMF